MTIIEIIIQHLRDKYPNLPIQKTQNRCTIWLAQDETQDDTIIEVYLVLGDNKINIIARVDLNDPHSINNIEQAIKQYSQTILQEITKPPKPAKIPKFPKFKAP